MSVSRPFGFCRPIDFVLAGEAEAADAAGVLLREEALELARG